MKKTTYLSLFLTIFSLTSPAVKAETKNLESFSECVMNLYKGPFTASQSAENCLNAFRGKQPNESFSACVERLYKGPFTSNNASENCQKAFTNANTGNNNSKIGNPPRGTNIIVIPDQQQRPRRTERQCIHKTFGNQWPDIHCRGSSSSFEWRTIYFD